MKKLKILILNYEYPPLGGGAASATKNILKQFAKREDLEIDLVTSSTEKYREEQFSENIHIYFLDIKKKGPLHLQGRKDLLRYSWKAFLKAKKLNRQKDYDVIHAFFGIPCGFLAMLIDDDYIVSLRGSDVPFYSKKYYFLDKYIFQHLSKLIWKKAKFVIANSHGLRDLAHKTIPDQEIGVIYNGIDWVEKLDKEREEKFVVVSTSRLIERKGLDYLVKAFGEFAKDKEDVELRMYGGGDQRELLEKIIGDYDIEDKVILFGEQPQEVLLRDTVGTSVFVLPSKNEGMSNCLLESMARGLAIIATDVGGTRELMDERNGFIVDKENVEQIREALEKLYKDRSLVEKMGNASRERVRDFGWDKIADQYIELYKKVDD
jgi:glycosyltransferase involved in cell wall biosynthesis